MPRIVCHLRHLDGYSNYQSNLIRPAANDISYRRHRILFSFRMDIFVDVHRWRINRINWPLSSELVLDIALRLHNINGVGMGYLYYYKGSLHSSKETI